MHSAQQPKTITLAVTGASGSLFAREMLTLLHRDERVGTVNFVASDHALRVCAEELGVGGRNDLVERLLGSASPKVQLQSNTDIGANIASGSYPTDAMIILPCSMGTLSKVANGLADQLIERAADVCLKEQRRLVLCVRETPLNKVHLRNMSLAAEAGATIFPIIPAYYYNPATLADLAREYCYRVLAHVGLAQPGAFQWKNL
jgi:flavin prenyltransferase